MKTAFALAAAVSVAIAAEQPEIVSANIAQNTDRSVSITYTLANGPAIVTVDILTNGVSIGGENIRNLTGDVNKIVDGNTEHTIKWDARKSWPDHNVASASAVVKAWSLDAPPDYMAVDLTRDQALSFYPDAGQVPGGATDQVYKQTILLMRKINAKNIPWAMGGAGNRTAIHTVTLDHDYFIGVYEFTQLQWYLLMGTKPSAFTNTQYWQERPVEYVPYCTIRESADGTANTAYQYPNAPAEASLLGKLRGKSGLSFDLPSEAEWEYACRAGNAGTLWNDGSPFINKDEDANLNRLGRYSGNGKPTSHTGDVSQGTATVGSYLPNAFGLYDMHGNVWEWCLDWYNSNIANNSTGAVILTATDSTPLRVVKGGSCALDASNAMSAAVWRRAPTLPNGNTDKQLYFGFRVVCPVSVQ